MEELTKMKQVLIDAGKKVLIVVKKGVVQLVIGEMMGYSNDHALVEKRGFRDFWEKVKAAVAKSNANIRDFFKSNWDKVAPKIKEAFDKVKAGTDKFVEVITEKGQLILVQIKEGAQKVVVDFKNDWAKVQQAFKDLDAHIKAKVDEYKPQIIEALNKFQEDVEDYKDFVIEEGNKIIIRINKFGVKIVEDAQNVMDKVNEAADKLSDDVRDYVKAKVEELKPQIIEELNKGKQIIVDAAKGVVIQIRDQIVRIITGAQTGTSDEVATYGALDGLWEKIKAVAVKLSPDVLKIVIELKGEIIRIIDAEEIAESSDEFAMEKRGIKDIWAKVKAAAKKLGDDIRGRVETAIDELKPQILDSLNKIKEVTINAGKKVIIQIKGEIVRIITGATEASSDEFEFMEKRGIADIWGKVKEAMKKLGDNIKADAKKTIEELRPKITEALENLKKIVIDAGKKIVIQINDEIVKIVVGDNTAESS